MEEIRLTVGSGITKNGDITIKTEINEQVICKLIEMEEDVTKVALQDLGWANPEQHEILTKMDNFINHDVIEKYNEYARKADLLDEAVTIIQNCNMIFRNEFSDEYIENSSTIGFEIRIIQSFLNKIQKAKGE